MNGEKTKKIEYGKKILLEEVSKVSRIQFRIDNPFPKNSVAKEYF